MTPTQIIYLIISTIWDKGIKMTTYEKERNKLIPLAEKRANKKVGKNIPAWNSKKLDEWSMVFHREMRRLSAEVLGCP